MKRIKNIRSGFCSMALVLFSYHCNALINTENMDITGTFNVPVPFINTGNLYVIGNCNIVGDLLDAPSIHFGISKNNIVDPTNFIAEGNIGGIPLLQVHSGSTFSSAFHVSGISQKLIIEENAAAIFSKALSVPGQIENYGTISFAGNTLFTIANMLNHGDLNIANTFNIPKKFTNTGSVYVTGNGAILGAMHGDNLNIGVDSFGNNIPNNFEIRTDISKIPFITIGSGSALIINSISNLNYEGNISGLGAIINNGVFTMENAITIDIAEIINRGALNITNNFTVPNTFTNYGDIYVYGENAAINGSISGGKSLNIGKKSQGDIVDVDITLTDAVDDIGAINIFSDLNAISSSSFTNIGAMKISANASANFAANYASSGVVENNGNLYIHNAFTATEINNSSGANLYIQNAANTISSHINNAYAANLYVDNDLSMPGKNLTNQGIVYVNGERNLIGNKYTSPGINVFGIRNDLNYDSLNASCSVDLSNGCVVVNTNFLGESDTNYSWTILQAPEITTNNNTILAIPCSTVFKKWDGEITDEAIIVKFNRVAFAKVLPQTEVGISTALEDMAHLLTDEAYHLIHNFSECNSMHECHENYEKLKPAINASAKYTATQNAALNKTETRISNLREQRVALNGIAFGDLSPQNSVWLAGFGSIAHQKTTTDIAGYNAKALGALLGFDKFLGNCIVGGAFGWSNSNIDEGTSSNITSKIIGYHALLYGNINITNNNFLEWLVTGVSNANSGGRIVNINNTDFSVNSNYHSWQSGFRFNLGQNVDFDYLRYSLLATIRYTALQQPGYDETGSPAALSVAGQGVGNILTVGGGVRASSLNRNRWLANTRELRAMVTYDAITTENITTANFVIGGSDFTISNSASRWALQLGASYGLAIASHMQLEFSYNFELRNHYTDNTGEVKLRYLF